MKFLVLTLCLCYALANASLLDDLDKLLSDNNANRADHLDKLLSSPADNNADSEDEINQLKNLMEQMNTFESTASEDTASEDDPDLLEKRVSPKPIYGYCLDGKTRAQGPNDRGCARTLCYDATIGDCNRYFRNEFRIKDRQAREAAISDKCYLKYAFYRTHCPFTCGMCKPASPKTKCEKRYGKQGAKFGCCAMGGWPALNQDKRGCMKCHDRYKHACQQFMQQKFGIKCYTNSYRMRSFLYQHCPVSCGLCRKGEL